MVAAKPLEPSADVGKRLVPRARLELTGAADPLERGGDAVGIVDDLHHRQALDAAEPLAVGVFVIGSQARQSSVLDGGDQTAQGFADAAEGGLFLNGHRRISRWVVLAESNI